MVKRGEKWPLLGNDVYLIPRSRGKSKRQVKSGSATQRSQLTAKLEWRMAVFKGLDGGVRYHYDSIRNMWGKEEEKMGKI